MQIWSFLGLFRFHFRIGKANKFSQILFCICFRNDHVGHAHATIAGHTYKKHIPEIFCHVCFRNPTGENPTSCVFLVFRLYLFL